MTDTSRHMPLVSVIIPNHGRVDLLHHALESVARQSYPHYEIIVVDDGSGDACVQQYHLPEHARLLRHPESRGPAAARNTALRVARGAYLAFLDSDDIWLPDKLARQVQLLEDDAEAGLTYCRMAFIDLDGRVLEDMHPFIEVPRDAFPALVRRCCIQSPSCVMMRRALLERIGGFAETPATLSEDWEVWVRAASEAPVITDSSTLCQYRKHAGQITCSKRRLAEADVNAFTAFYPLVTRTRPELLPVVRTRFARKLRRLARYQLTIDLDARAASRTARAAIAFNPGSLLGYAVFAFVILYAPYTWITRGMRSR